MRWIVDDVSKFVQREVKRGARYDGILLDPPVFGRGTKGEVWRLEEDLGELLANCAKLVAGVAKPIILLNIYATPIYPASFLRIMEQAFPKTPFELGELCLQEKSGKLLQTGFSIRS